MALSAFDDKSKEPQPVELKTTLGRSSSHWASLIAHIAAEYAPLDKTWSFAGAKWGWSLRLKQKKRTVLYMTPCNRHFLVGFALGEKAVEAAHACPLPDSIITVIDEAKRYAEGRTVRFAVKVRKDLEIAKRLAAEKMANRIHGFERGEDDQKGFRIEAGSGRRQVGKNRRSPNDAFKFMGRQLA